MSASKAAIIVVIVVFTIVLAGIVLYTSQPKTTTVTPLPTPMQQTTPSVTPTPSMQTIQGDIITVSSTPVGYKDSYVATVEQEGGTSALIYITQDTTIMNSQGTEVTRTSLRAGTTIQAMTTPAEGGFEATQIQIIPSNLTNPTIIPTRTVPSVTPVN